MEVLVVEGRVFDMYVKPAPNRIELSRLATSANLIQILATPFP